jgi:hypothetical protein
MTPWFHSVSSSKQWGGQPEEYYDLHNWLDETKQHTGDWTHRALRHHSAGVEWAVERFGPVLVLSCGKKVPVKPLAEQHIEEDCGFVPTPADWLAALKAHPAEWMLRVGKKSKEFPLELSGEAPPGEPT